MFSEIYCLHLEAFPVKKPGWRQKLKVILEATAYRRLHVSVDAESDAPALKFSICTAVLAAVFQL